MTQATPDLQPGDILSYSAGSTQTGPMGFRKLGTRGAGGLMSVVSRWPDIARTLARHTVMFINAYPAAVGAFSAGITVDTYLSPRVLSRALQLGKLGAHPVILVGQPLFLAHALLSHMAAERPMPDAVILLVGGYAMQQSLERMLVAELSPRVSEFSILQGFGAAEVDAGCFWGRERNAKCELIYHPRPDIELELDGDELLLTLRDAAGTAIVARFRTGDCARPEGDGWVLWNHRRYHPDVAAELESWSVEDWKRRTGYVRRHDDTMFLQLREGYEPQLPAEVEFFEFARRFGFSWLDKPYWR